MADEFDLGLDSLDSLVGGETIEMAPPQYELPFGITPADVVDYIDWAEQQAAKTYADPVTAAILLLQANECIRRTREPYGPHEAYDPESH
ncbi:hypothetical protein COV20_00575 [Candidatus Woesearchaeota archaeon CG10_big_fil_rev_8_21_14_0_10_45_16]|nr:MAG: hypothetical protein COV20_00575 [Candidatus Woesearchaeota archaeon CG10_big_fil_rev_8_21_14_0_10_45_16]